MPEVLEIGRSPAIPAGNPESLSSQFFPSGLICLGLATSLSRDHLLRFAGLCPSIAEELGKSAGLYEGYSVGTHTLMALNQRHKYSLGNNLAAPNTPDSSSIGMRGIDFSLLLHDLAKHVPGQEKDTAQEHRRTREFLQPFILDFPFSARQTAVILDIISNDSLGKLLYSAVNRKRPSNEQKQRMLSLKQFDIKSFEDQYHNEMETWERFSCSEPLDSQDLLQLVQRTAQSFVERAQKLEIPAKELLQLQVVFYQSDTSAYTYDASCSGTKGTPSLDYLFVRTGESFSKPLFKLHPSKQRLEFSGFFEVVYQSLESCISA